MFKVGDTVETIDDVISGVVVAINLNIITIESNEGFLLDYSSSELLKKSADDGYKITNFDVVNAMGEKEYSKKNKPQPIKPKERNAPKMEVDLHIHQLRSSSRGLSNHEILSIQIEAAKRQLEFAIRKRIQKVVFIHGVGEGVLKEELKYLFNRYDNLKHYDADFQKYGLGATEVYLFQNS